MTLAVLVSTMPFVTTCPPSLSDHTLWLPSVIVCPDTVATVSLAEIGLVETNSVLTGVPLADVVFDIVPPENVGLRYRRVSIGQPVWLRGIGVSFPYGPCVRIRPPFSWNRLRFPVSPATRMSPTCLWPL